MTCMFVADRALAALARQLAEPSGFAGRIVGRLLNRGNRAVVEAAVEAVDVDSGSVVADIGFGGGVGVNLLLQRVGDAGSVHGVELSTRMLDEARRRFRDQIARGHLHLHDARMENLPFPDSSLDAVISTNTIYFIADLTAALSELARVLRPAGRLALGIGDPDQMARMPFTRHGFRLRPIPGVIDQIRAAGLADVEDQRVGEGPEAFHLLVCTKVRA